MHSTITALAMDDNNTGTQDYGEQDSGKAIAEFVRDMKDGGHERPI